MSNFENEFISLRCPHCNGSVKITPAQLDESFVESGDSFVYIGTVGTEQVKCSHCKTEFVRKQRVDVAVDGNGTINTGGGAFIGGPISVNGDFVGRDRITAQGRSVSIRGDVSGSSIVTGDDVVIIRKKKG